MEVTIGIPFFNNERDLLQAIRSVFAQTHHHWRLILVNDGSTDRSVEIANSIDDERVVVINDGRNLGLPHRLNQLTELTQTKWYARMDADDIMHPERIARQLDFVRRNPRIDVVGTSCWVINEHGTVTGVRDTGSAPITARASLSGPPFIHPSILGRTAWFRQHQYDTQLRRWQDGELWCRTLLAGEAKFANIDERLFFYREPAQMSYEKISKNYIARRRFVGERGPALVGAAQTQRIVVKIWLKQIAWRVASWGGFSNTLRSWRSQEVSNEMLAEPEAVLQTIDRIYLPKRSEYQVA